jgi:hypothetical protein
MILKKKHKTSPSHTRSGALKIRICTKYVPSLLKWKNNRHYTTPLASGHLFSILTTVFAQRTIRQDKRRVMHHDLGCLGAAVNNAL